MLTDKARKDFVEYHYNQVNFTEESHEDHWKLFLDTTEEIHQQASIVDWLDSVGIYVEVGYLHAYKEWYRDVSTETGSCYIRGWETRQEATKAAIEKANELYNGQEKH